MSKYVSTTKRSVEGLYNFKVKPFFKGLGFRQYVIKNPEYMPNSFLVYFNNSELSGWAILKVLPDERIQDGKLLKIKWDRGELIFFQDLVKSKVHPLLIIECNNGFFYSDEVKRRYNYRSLKLLELETFFL